MKVTYSLPAMINDKHTICLGMVTNDDDNDYDEALSFVKYFVFYNYLKLSFSHRCHRLTPSLTESRYV